MLGGNAFVGKALALEAIARGHDVTCAVRGVSGPLPVGSHHVHADRDLNHTLASVGHHEWDVLIDVARHPGHVRRALEVLEARTRYAVYISSLSAYDRMRQGADESGALKPALKADVITDVWEYGPAKVACEDYYRLMMGPRRTAILRCGLIGGPGDQTGRSGWYTWRCAHPADGGDTVLVPQAKTPTAAVLDVRDLAAFALGLAETHTAGTFDTLGQLTTVDEHLAVAQQVAGTNRRLVHAQPRWLRKHHVGHWLGPQTLPLWIDDPDYAQFNTHSGAAARAAGLTHRPLNETLADVLAYEETRPPEQPRKTGLTDDFERGLLSQLGG